MKVLKFGGTSMGSAESLKNVADIIEKNVLNNVTQVVTCSAMSGVTNQLISIGELLEKLENKSALEVLKSIEDLHAQAAQDLGITENFKTAVEPLISDLRGVIKGIGLIHELSDRSRAYLCSFGEKLSTNLLTEYLKTKNIAAVQVDSDFIHTQGYSWLEDEIDWEKTKTGIETEIKTRLAKNELPVVTGFFGSNPNGGLSLLGRGGSDYSGAILTVGLECKTLEIWTDVDGFLSADPRIVNNAQLIDEIGFEEVSELCFFGAKVLHPKTIRPVVDSDGEVWIKNTFNPEVAGTKITRKTKASTKAVVSISSKKVLMISLDIFATHESKRKVFSDLFVLAEKHNVSVDMIASSEAQISFCVEEKYKDAIDFFAELDGICPNTSCDDRSVICIVSPKEVQGQSGIAAKIFEAIAKSKASVDMYSQNASEIAQLIVVKSDDVNNSIAKIHEELVINN